MKTILLIALLALSLCEGETGGWEKKNFNSNDAIIFRAFQTAAAAYSKANGGSYDDLRGLTVYSQIVNGENYKICFVDSRSDVPTIFEYILYKPLPNEGEDEINFTVSSSRSLESTEGLISFTNPTFTKIEITLKTALSKINNTFKFINFIYPVENDKTIFYIIRATTTEGEKNIIFAQDKESNEYFEPEIL